MLLSSLITLNATAQEVVLSGIEREDYITTVLSKAISYFPEKKYQLTFYGKNIPKLRVHQLMINNQGISINAAGTTVDREKKLLAIRIPILKGLHGWRIPLVTKSNKALFKNIKTIEQFKQFTAGQLHSWSDVAVLESNNIAVEKGGSYQGLFEMLENNRFDYFPRAIIEIDGELQKNLNRDITIEPNIMLHYPTAYYFYVSKANTQLAHDIKLGLEEMIQSGEFDKIFNQHFGLFIDKIRRQNRTVFQLQNPHLPKKTPLQRKKLWLNLAQ